MKRRNPTWQEAINAGIVTPERAKEARLTPTVARVIPEALTPQDLLTAAVAKQWPNETQSNYRPILSDHNFELDIAFPALCLGIEVDGWQFHGKHKAGFLRDRRKDRLLLLEGWRVWRFAASEILKDMPMVLETIQRARIVCGASSW